MTKGRPSWSSKAKTPAVCVLCARRGTSPVPQERDAVWGRKESHARRTEKSQQDIPAFILTNVECDAPLVPIETAKSRGVKSVAPTPKGISFSRLFNLDDIGAQIGQHRTGKWPGDIARHFDNTNSLKRVIHFITPDRRLASEYKNLTDDNRG